MVFRVWSCEKLSLNFGKKSRIGQDSVLLLSIIPPNTGNGVRTTKTSEELLLQNILTDAKLFKKSVEDFPSGKCGSAAFCLLFLLRIIRWEHVVLMNSTRHTGVADPLAA